MKQRRILIVDSDQKNLKVLEANFQGSSYSVFTALSYEEAIHRLNINAFDVLLTIGSSSSVSGFQLLKEVQRNPNHHSTSVIFLSTKSDVWNRVKSLKLGAKDYIVKPIHVSEIVARVNMVQSRIESSREQQADSSNTFNGRLEDLSVIDLIEALGTERKTGVLSLNNENGHSGQIVFRHGSVISASAEFLRAEEAVYKMIYWNRGRFSMSFSDVTAEDEFTSSNLGLLLQGAKRMDLRNELLKQLPSLDAIIITTSNFKKILSQKDINAELREFMKLFDGERSLGRIIDDSHENEIVTLKRIVKLYKLGFLHVLRNFSSDQPVQFRSEYEDEYDEYEQPAEDPELREELEQAEEKNADFEAEIDRVVPDNFPKDEEPRPAEPEGALDMQQHELPSSADAKPEPLKQIDNQHKHVLIIGADELNNRFFLQSFSADDPQELNLRALDTPIYTGQVQLRGGSQLNLMAVKPDEQYLMLLDYFYEKTFGCIFLIDLEASNWSYQRYLFKAISEHLQVPTIVVGKHGGMNSDFESQIIRDKIDLDEDYTLRFIADFDADTCRRILFTLVNEAQGHAQSIHLDSERLATK